MARLFVFILLLTLVNPLSAQDSWNVERPKVSLSSIEQTYTFTSDQLEGEQKVVINEQVHALIFENGKASIDLIQKAGEQSIRIELAGEKKSFNWFILPLWISLLPPFIAIGMALITKEVVYSLLTGIFVGAASIGYAADGLAGIAWGFLHIIDQYIIGALNDWGHLAVVLFSILIGALVALISKNGGMEGVVNRISKLATNAKSGQLVTWALGVGIFFDDYANTLVVGNTMRSVTDRLRISRAKLAYIVDSTAAPMASIAFVTTWIGAELGYIQDGVSKIDGYSEGAYSVFLNSLSYSYYPILTLIFILFLILQGKDYGPMLDFERKARQSGVQDDITEENAELQLFDRKEGVTAKAYNAIIPILILIIGTIVGLLITGHDPSVWQDDSLGFGRKLSTIIGNSDSYTALLWSSLLALVTAAALTQGQKIMGAQEVVETSIDGFKTMINAVVILVLAWSLATITEELETARFLQTLWSPDYSPYILPAITFIISALVAFSTGSSWGTMAILYPIMIPSVFSIGDASGMEQVAILPIFYNVTSCVLAGSVLGDHCSPISDTTILSSLASSCNHIDHVRTQIPYALTVGVVAVLGGTTLSAFGLPNWICFAICLTTLYLIVRMVGKKVES